VDRGRVPLVKLEELPPRVGSTLPVFDVINTRARVYSQKNKLYMEHDKYLVKFYSYGT
jgi:hypothetical protein